MQDRFVVSQMLDVLCMNQYVLIKLWC